MNFIVTFILCLFASMIGYYAQNFSGIEIFKVMGAMVIAMIIGICYQINHKFIDNSRKEIGFISHKFLRLGIILLGFKLSISELLKGLPLLLVAVFVVPFTIILVLQLAKFFKIDKNLSLLTACGCGICGAAAVMGVSSVVDADDDDVVVSVSIVCLLGTLFTFIVIFVSKFLGLTYYQHGVYAGASLHEIAHAIAAAGSGPEGALAVGTISKLSRVLLLAPVSILVSNIFGSKSDGKKAKVNIPYFMLGFIATAIISPYIPVYIVNKLIMLAFILLGMAMCALGMNVKFDAFLKKGIPMFKVALIVSVILNIVCLLIAKYLF